MQSPLDNMCHLHKHNLILVLAFVLECFSLASMTVDYQLVVMNVHLYMSRRQDATNEKRFGNLPDGDVLETSIATYEALVCRRDPLLCVAEIVRDVCSSW